MLCEWTACTQNRAVSEPSVKSLLDKAVRRSTGGARAEIHAKMKPPTAEEVEQYKKKHSGGLWGKLTGSASEPPPPPPGVHIRLHSLAREASDTAIVVGVELLESVRLLALEPFIVY